MRKIFTLFLGVLMATSLLAQKPEALIKKAVIDPVIGGEIDTVWNQAEENAIDKIFKVETPSIGLPGETWWKALWNSEGIFILVNITDNDYYPYWQAGGTNGWQYDHVELYFDANYVLEDGMGGHNPGNAGNYQIAPNSSEANSTGIMNDDFSAGSGIKYAFMVEDPNWVAEYFIPFTWLKDKDGMIVDKTGPIGFDITVIDNDSPGDDNGRQRTVWANIGGKDESWNNMDDAGIIMLDGAEAGTQVESITLTGGEITTDGGTLQIVAEILPADAELKDLKWTVAAKEGSSGRATISSSGVVTGIMDGVVVVNASSTDGSFIDADPVEVIISGQKVTVDKVNLIKNGNFDLFGTNGAATNWGGWVDGVYGATTIPGTVVDGVVELYSILSHASENWHYQLNQNGLQAMPDIPYILKFKAWAANDRKICVDFEDTSANSYNRYGASSDPESNGRSEWTWDITTEPTWYTFHVTFDQIVPTTDQKIQFMVSQATGTVYLDSISLISEADMALVPVLEQNLESFKIYPNPADTKLHISLTTENTTVAIYNSVGVKMEEVVVPGTHHVFDVSRYTKGLYIVKANNSVMKFVK